VPHLVILYTANLDAQSDMKGLCRDLCDTMLDQRDEVGEQVFPTAGTRVLAYPAPHYAVADGQGDYAFVYLNLRMTSGRSGSVKEQIGQALLARTKAHFAALFDQRHLGLTLQIDEGAESFNARHNNMYSLFAQ
jgi:5-carboxymethyl-2-hydroxymuconate isomerase